MKRLLSLAALGTIALASSPAWSYPASPCVVVTATCRTVAAGSGTLAARAVFQVSGSTLSVMLSNISSNDVLLPIDVLTGVFFNLWDSTHTNKVSLTVAPNNGTYTAMLDPSGTAYQGATPVTVPGNDVSGEWAHKQGFAAVTFGSLSIDNGVSSAGLGLFGPGDRFNTGSNLAGPAAPNGLQYGIASAGDNPATGNGGGSGVLGNVLTKDTVTFTLGIVGSPSINLLRKGSLDVAFQYGTDLSEPHLIPLPATGALLLAGLGAFAAVRRKGKRA